MWRQWCTRGVWYVGWGLYCHVTARVILVNMSRKIKIPPSPPHPACLGPHQYPIKAVLSYVYCPHLHALSAPTATLAGTRLLASEHGDFFTPGWRRVSLASGRAVSYKKSNSRDCVTRENHWLIASLVNKIFVIHGKACIISFRTRYVMFLNTRIWWN